MLFLPARVSREARPGIGRGPQDVRRRRPAHSRRRPHLALLVDALRAGAPRAIRPRRPPPHRRVVPARMDGLPGRDPRLGRDSPGRPGRASSRRPSLPEALRLPGGGDAARALRRVPQRAAGGARALRRAAPHDLRAALRAPAGLAGRRSPLAQRRRHRHRRPRVGRSGDGRPRLSPRRCSSSPSWRWTGTGARPFTIRWSGRWSSPPAARACAPPAPSPAAATSSGTSTARAGMWGRSDPGAMSQMRWFLREGWGRFPWSQTGEARMEEPEATLLLPSFGGSGLDLRAHPERPRRAAAGRRGEWTPPRAPGRDARSPGPRGPHPRGPSLSRRQRAGAPEAGGRRRSTPAPRWRSGRARADDGERASADATADRRTTAEGRRSIPAPG